MPVTFENAGEELPAVEGADPSASGSSSPKHAHAVEFANSFSRRWKESSARGFKGWEVEGLDGKNRYIRQKVRKKLLGLFAMFDALHACMHVT